MLKQVCEWYDFVILENVTPRSWACLFRFELINGIVFIQICFFKFEFNSQAQILALRVMKDNYASSTSCLIVDAISIDRLFMCKLERTNDLK